MNQQREKTCSKEKNIFQTGFGFFSNFRVGGFWLSPRSNYYKDILKLVFSVFLLSSIDFSLRILWKFVLEQKYVKDCL